MAVGAMLMAFVGLIVLLNGILGWAGSVAGYPGASIESILGALLAPLTWLLGVPWEHAGLVGGAVAQKFAFNEFFVYATVSPALKAGTLDAQTSAIVCFALCGFANLASIAIKLESFQPRPGAPPWTRSLWPARHYH